MDSIIESELAQTNAQLLLVENSKERKRTYNVLDYGFVSDGKNGTDNKDKMVQLLSIIPEVGGTIYFPNGHYRFNNGLDIKKNNITIECENDVHLYFRGISAGGHGIGFVGGDIGDTSLNSNYIQNCNLIGGNYYTDVNADGTANNENAIGVLRGRNIKISNVTIPVSGRKGITCQVGCDNIVIESCKVELSYHDGISIEDGCKNIKINDIDVIESKRIGVNINSDKTNFGINQNIKLNNLRIEKSGGSELMCVNFDKLTINNVDLYNSGFVGINIQYGDYVYIDKAIIDSARDMSIYIRNINNIIDINSMEIIEPKNSDENVSPIKLESNNATIKFNNIDVLCNEVNFNYVMDIIASPNFISSYGCSFPKGKLDGNRYKGWNPKNCRDIFGGNSFILDDRRLKFLGDSIPKSGEYFRGDTMYYNDTDLSGYYCAICTSSGSPGVWKKTGPLEG